MEAVLWLIKHEYFILTHRIDNNGISTFSVINRDIKEISYDKIQRNKLKIELIFKILKFKDVE